MSRIVVGTTAGTRGPQPTLVWVDCGDGFQCTTATVPLDYRASGGGTIGLGVTRKPATDPARRISSLFVSPGGPGASLDSAVRFYGTSLPPEVPRGQADHPHRIPQRHADTRL